MASILTPEYIATLRRMTGAQKLRTAFQLYWSARRLKAARLRQQHPDWSEEQVQQRVKEIFMYAVT
ncbi:MAG: hypothetical protein B7Z37_15030 [Verrucomicrobia bacterium 12-59-8]|nr:MAG: hypothetical protein B7Z37_15030 [Verrucomicrobia bacterium 12-59-8]